MKADYMKVCMLTTHFAKHLRRLAKALVRNGIEVEVVTPWGEDTKNSKSWEGVVVHQFTYWLPKNQQRVAHRYSIPLNLKKYPIAKIQLPFFILAFLIASLKVSKNCDVIHAHMTPVALLAYIIRWLINTPVVVTPWGTDLRDLPKKFSEYVLNRADAVSVVGESSELLNLDFRNYSVIPTPIDEGTFLRNIDLSGFKAGFKLKDEFVVTFIARLYDFKDPLTFVQAIPEVLKEIKNVKFFIVGRGVLFDAVKSTVKQSGIENSVFTTGLRHDVNVILKASTLFTAISPVENVWSNTIAEAMFMGIPCIITKAGASEKFFTHMKNCYMIEPRNPKALAEAIVYLLRNPKTRKKIAEGGLKFLKKKNKDTAKVVELTKDLYTKVLKNYKSVA